MVVLSDLSLQYFSNAEFLKIKVFVDLLDFELKSPLTLLLSPPGLSQAQGGLSQAQWSQARPQEA